jgi:exodeoxyribonuclease V beta subunit
MKKPANFDVLTHPLKGTHLVEASAGTGKTYNITTLVVRMLLETSLTIDQILVVSFTKAATADLRGRVRERIRETLNGFVGKKSKDPIIQSIVASHRGENDVNQLRAALDNFDRAAIYTIHSFCQRVLVEFAFQSGEPFSAEFIEDARTLYSELCQDHWASTAYEADPQWLATISKIISSPSSLQDLIKHAAERPDLSVLPIEMPVEDQQAGEELDGQFKRCASLWQSDQAAIRDQLDYKEGKGLLKADYKPEKIKQSLEQLDRFLADPAPAMPVIFPGSEMFTAEALRKSTRKKCDPPPHPFFETWQKYIETANKILRILFIRLQHELYANGRARLEQHKETFNVRAYSDLLSRLANALNGPGGENLAADIFTRYPAALIDEFQDTNPIQFSIFKQIYNNDRGNLFLIGDPKQAIYAFRGGDVYAYLQAVQDTGPCTLGTNYRSDRPLVDALERIYKRHPKPFIDGRIPFLEVSAHEGQRFRGPAGEAAPVQIKMIRKANKGKKRITAGWAERGKDDFAALVAIDIIRFLNSDTTIQRKNETDGSERWTAPGPSDVVVLVRRNKEAVHMQDALMSRGVHSVTSQTNSVFTSYEASELWAVLEAIIHPASERLLRVAVTTNLIGLNASRLAELIANDALWTPWVTRFRDWREKWARRGFSVMFRSLLIDRLDSEIDPAQQRLVALPRGERMMTNLLHLGELLQLEGLRHSLGPVGLLEWFAKCRIGEADCLDDEELRLESDTDAAVIMTVHKAKGLQFPVVWYPYGHFCPRTDTIRPLFHGDPPEERATISLDPDAWPEFAQRAAVEQAAEEQRVLYVSLTRALHRVTLFWGEWYQRDRCAVGTLLHPGPGISEKTSPAELVEVSERHVASLDENGRMGDLQKLASSAPGLIEASWIDEKGDAVYKPRLGDSESLILGTFSGHIRTSWRRTSYSSLTSSPILSRADPADHDENVTDENSPADNIPGTLSEDDLPCGFLSFPSGRKPGIVLHGIFEAIDFQKSGADLEQIVKMQLARAQLGAAAFIPATVTSVRDVLATPLGDELGDFTLSKLPVSRRLDEMPFTFSISRRGHDAPSLQRTELINLLRSHNCQSLAERVERLEFDRLRGNLTGLVDLVFEQAGRYWIVDYKSNLIGERIGDYHREALINEVVRHNYDLQYLIYAVALHRYLQLRLPDYSFARHFGGVRYLFLRGMKPATGANRGVLIESLSESLVTELSAMFSNPAEVLL